jgi:hypothetical protein
MISQAQRPARPASWCVLAALAIGGCAPESRPETAPESPPEESAQARQAIEPKPAWEVTGAMKVARQGATATRLANGRVLVAGGQGVGAVDVGEVLFETAEIFNPKTGAFSPVAAKMSTKRTLHSAVAIAGGRVLVAGGRGGTSPLTAEIYDPATAKWTLTANLAHEHIGAPLTLLADGRALLTGGDLGLPGGAAEIFDPSTGAWTDTGLMTRPRRFHTATLLADGRVLVAGGERYDVPKATTGAEIFNPASSTWTKVAAMNVARTQHTATLLESGEVLVVGGTTNEALGELASAERYSPTLNKWTLLAPMESPRAMHSATRLENGAVLVAGGFDTTSSVLRTTELFDPASERWIPSGLLGHGRFAHTAVVLADRAVLVAGGEYQSSAEIYRSAEDGQPCEVDRQCASGHCADGVVCCNDVCSGQCVTCLLAGAEGKCSLAAAGSNPHQSCGLDGPCDDVCDEAGACASRVGEVCVAPSCTGNGEAIAEATCMTSGGTCPAVTVDCTPYRCGFSASSPTGGCLERCQSIDDCADGYACDSEGQCRSPPDVAGAEAEACSAGPPAPGSPPWAVAWLAGIALILSTRRALAGRFAPSSAPSSEARVPPSANPRAQKQKKRTP